MDNDKEVKPIMKDSTLEGLHRLMQEHYGVDGSTNTLEHKGEQEEAGNYAEGGDVQSILAQLAQMPTSPSSFDVSGGDSAPAVNLPPQTGGPSLAIPSAANNYSFLNQSQPPTPAPTPAMPPTPPPTQAPATQPQMPSIGDMASKMNQTPPTDYNFYKDISAEDRAKLYQQLTQQQKSPGSMIASGLGGIGDAIARSYGGQNTNYQKDIMANQEQQKEGALGAMDTQRQQKTQDTAANMSLMKADPKAPISVGFRQFLKMQGINAPSGASFAMLEPMFGDLAKMYEAKQTNEATIMGHQVDALGKVESGGLMQGVKDWFNPSEAKAQSRLQELGGIKPQPGSSQNGWGNVRRS